eukprot:3623594-Rhodomonas_salina.1
MLRTTLVLGGIAAASAFSVPLTMQRIGSNRQGSAGRQGSAAPARQGSMGAPARQGSMGAPARQGSMGGGRPAAAPAKVAVSESTELVVGPNGLWGEGVVQGPGIMAIPDQAPPAGLSDTLPGYVGFDPLGLSNLYPIQWLQEAEIKNGRLAMMAVAGAVAQDLTADPGISQLGGGAKMMGLHDALIKGSTGLGDNVMLQMFLAISIHELFTIPMFLERLQSGTGIAGDYGFDPLGLGTDQFEKNQYSEIIHGRTAMIAFGGMVHHYLLSGKGPIAFISGPPFQNCVAKASQLPGAGVAAFFAPGQNLDAICY